MQQHVPEKEEEKNKIFFFFFFETASHKYVGILYVTNSNNLNICVEIATENKH